MHPYRSQLASLLFLVGFSWVQAATPPASGTPPNAPQGGNNHIPPREAYTACDGKKDGDAASFTSPRGETISGRCRMIPARLAVMPDHPPRQQDGQPQSPPPKP